MPTGASLEGYTLALIDRMGDSALVAISHGSITVNAAAPGAESEPASVLVIKTEAGWRIRDVLDPVLTVPAG